MFSLFLILAGSLDAFITWRGWYDRGSLYRRFDIFELHAFLEDAEGSVRRTHYLISAALVTVGVIGLLRGN